MALRSVRVCRQAREEFDHPVLLSASRQGIFRRGLIVSLLLAGVSLAAIAATDGARAQETQLPQLTVEAGKPKGKKKPAPAKSPSPQAAPASAPQPQPPPVGATAAVAASDVPYTVPAGVSVVTSEDLSTFGGGHIDSALRSQPGTFTRMSPQNPGLAVNIRGFEGSGRVNTMIDGVRQNFRFTGHEAQGFTYIDPSLVAGIDIARGAVSTAGGAGALAGAANFRTLDVEDILRPGQTMGGLTSLTWGSNEVGFSEMGAAAARSGGVSIAGAISRREPNDYENGDGETIPFTFQDLNSGLFKVNFQLNDEQSLRFGGVFYDNDFFANSYFQNVNSETFTAKYAYKPIDNDLIDFRLNGYRNNVVMKYDTDSTPLSGTAPTQGSAWGRVIDDEGWGFDGSNVSRFNLGSVRVRSEYGYEYFSDDVTAYNRFQPQLDGGVNPSGVSDVSGAFSQTTFSQSIFDFIVGLRYDMYGLDGHGVVPTGTPLPPGITPGPYTVDRSDGRFDPKLTLAAQVLDWLQPYVTYSESFRAPTISETLTGGIHPGGTNIAFQPNPFLDPEIQKGWEIGANVLQDDVLTGGDSFRLKADYYRMDIENYVTGCLIPTMGQPISYFCNVPGTSVVQGVEIQGMYDAGYAFTGFSYTYTNTDLPSQIDGFGAHSYLPDHTAVLSGGVRLLDRKLTLGGRLSYFSESYIGAVNVGPVSPYGSPYMPGYTLVDFFSSYKFDQGVELGFNVNNVFDEVYTPALSTTFSEGTKCYGSNQVGCIDSGIGRTFFLTAKAQF
jgi:hemoglobin/transferrin/lactoferrin receptor protein